MFFIPNTNVHPLIDVWLKINRGRDHAKAVTAAIEEWKRHPPATIKVRGALEPDGHTWSIKIANLPEFPPHWGTVIGDVIHNYRSALDVLAYGLAFIDNGREMSRTGFPLVMPQNWDDPGVQAAVKALSPTHRQMVRDCQPNGPTTADGGPQPLHLLGKLANDDKHRVIQPVFVAPVGSQWEIPSHGTNCEVVGIDYPLDTISGPVLYEGMTVLSLDLEVTGPSPYLPVRGGFTAHVSLRNSLSVEAVLKAIENEITAIVGRFEAEFDAPNAIALRSVERRGRVHPIEPLASEFQLEFEASPNAK